MADRILVGGYFERVCATHPDTLGGELDATSGFATDGFPIADSTVRCVLPDGSGGWIIGGAFSTVDGQPRQHLARILSDGSLAPWSPAVNGEVRLLLWGHPLSGWSVLQCEFRVAQQSCSTAIIHRRERGLDSG
ncbi:MAG: delta-60 repeat domain-containing protein [Flavobacteriales bacterium]|nr:delta-60 repeat domain-containing protein [Flavobacteriales bacterium]